MWHFFYVCDFSWIFCLWAPFVFFFEVCDFFPLTFVIFNFYDSWDFFWLLSLFFWLFVPLVIFLWIFETFLYFCDFSYKFLIFRIPFVNFVVAFWLFVILLVIFVTFVTFFDLSYYVFEFCRLMWPFYDRDFRVTFPA